jgi:hypothetical protein
LAGQLIAPIQPDTFASFLHGTAYRAEWEPVAIQSGNFRFPGFGLTGCSEFSVMAAFRAGGLRRFFD